MAACTGGNAVPLTLGAGRGLAGKDQVSKAVGRARARASNGTGSRGSKRQQGSLQDISTLHSSKDMTVNNKSHI